MPTTFVPFHEYAPDIAGPGEPYSTEATGWYPTEGGWLPLPTGLTNMVDNGTDVGTVVDFATGDTGGLRILGSNKAPYGSISDTGWVDQTALFNAPSIDNLALSSLVISPNGVSFCGRQNSDVEWKRYTLSYQGSVADLPGYNTSGSPSQSGVGGAQFYASDHYWWRIDRNPTLHWSGINDGEWWTPGRRSSDNKSIDGPITCVVPATDAGLGVYIFSERFVYYGQRVPDRRVFQFQKISDNYGVPAKHAAFEKRGVQYCFSPIAGFFALRGAEITGLGVDRLSRTLLSASGFDVDDYTKLLVSSPTDYPQVSGDTRDPFVRFAWVNDNTGSYQYVVYNTQTDQWSGINTIDGAAFIVSDYPDVKFYTSGSPGSVFDLTGPLVIMRNGDVSQLNIMTGTRTIQTGEVELIPGRQAQVLSVTPVIDTNSNAELKVAVAVREKPHSDLAWAPGDDLFVTTQSRSGAAAFEGRQDTPFGEGRTTNGRFHKFRVQSTGAVTKAKGVYVEFEDGGAM